MKDECERGVVDKQDIGSKSRPHMPDPVKSLRRRHEVLGATQEPGQGELILKGDKKQNNLRMTGGKRGVDCPLPDREIKAALVRTM